MDLSPIALFTYNRPCHTKQTIDALLQNPEAAGSDLIIFSDGAKDEAGEKRVDEVRQYLRTIKGFNSVRIVEREENYGLAKSIISGVNEVVQVRGRVIVLEDDLLTSPYFLQYMNDGLNEYQNDDRVISIHGYCYPVADLPSTFFLKGADCWGWATWQRGWKLFEPDGATLLAELRQNNLLDRFDFFGNYDFSGMLKWQIEGKNQSWAVRWYASALLHGKLTLYPGQTMVQNIGLDGSGRHCGDDGLGLFAAPLYESPVPIGTIKVEENPDALLAISKFFAKSKPTISTRIRNKIRSLIRRGVS